MTECPVCEKRHRDESGVDKCAERWLKREEAAEVRRNDWHRRADNLEREGVLEYVARRRHDGLRYEAIANELNRDYPMPVKIPRDVVPTYYARSRWAAWMLVALDTPRVWPHSPEAVASMISDAGAVWPSDVVAAMDEVQFGIPRGLVEQNAA